MEKLPMCRICLVQDVRMYVVVNKNLHELYEKLTDVPFVTEDRRPMLACFFCCTKLKQCFRFLRKCLEAEEFFAQMMNKEYERDPLISERKLSFYNGFMKTPIENINIVGDCQIESIFIKEELPEVCETVRVIIEPEQEHQSEELLESEEKSYPNVKYLPVHQDEGESTGATVVKKLKLDTRTTKLDGEMSAQQKKNENNRKFLSKEGIDSDDIHRHRTANVKEKNFQCDICHIYLSKKCHLTRHTRIHSGQQPFKCNICQRSFNDRSALTNHIRTHTGEKPFKCDICQRSYNRKSHLTSHIRVHSAKEHFKCDICQHSFIQKCHLRRHIRTHTGEKPFKCNICQRGFSNNSQLTIHMRAHTGERPFKCDVCQRGFYQRVHLRNHFCVHTGEKPHKCQICQRSFISKSAFSNHVKTHTRTGEDSFSFILGT